MSQEEREALRAEFLKRAAVEFEAMFDPEGQQSLQTLDQREHRAIELAQGMGQLALEQHLRRDGARRSSDRFATRRPRRRSSR